jgi:hypothetical protein
MPASKAGALPLGDAPSESIDPWSNRKNGLLPRLIASQFDKAIAEKR